MKFTIEKTDGIPVIALQGDLWGGEDTFRLKDEIKEAAAALIADGERRFVLDLKKTKRVNSTGIGVLVAIHSSIKGPDREVKVCEVTSRARTSLVVTGVLQLFDIHETRDEAVAAFVRARVKN